MTINATATGTNYGYPPPPPVTATASQVQITVQVGYILGASNLNTATVTVPKDGATVHLNGAGAPFNISSDHKWDFFRYDTFGSYGPTVVNQLQTSFPAPSGYTTIENQSPVFQLPQQAGDVYQIYTLSHSETFSGNINGANLPFVNHASSQYPSGSEVASGTATATAVYP